MFNSDYDAAYFLLLMQAENKHEVPAAICQYCFLPTCKDCLKKRKGKQKYVRKGRQ